MTHLDVYEIILDWKSLDVEALRELFEILEALNGDIPDADEIKKEIDCETALDLNIYFLETYNRIKFEILKYIKENYSDDEYYEDLLREIEESEIYANYLDSHWTSNNGIDLSYIATQCYQETDDIRECFIQKLKKELVIEENINESLKRYLLRKKLLEMKKRELQRKKYYRKRYKKF